MLENHLRAEFQAIQETEKDFIFLNSKFYSINCWNYKKKLTSSPLELMTSASSFLKLRDETGRDYYPT